MLGIAGCTAQYRNHGYVPDEEILSQVTVGVDTRDTVLEVIGAPTTSGVLDQGDFYYIRSRVKQFAWKRPEVIERTVMAVSFDQRGVVRNIETFGLEDGEVVRLQSRVTSSSTADKTFIRQLLGNLGRFNAASVLGGE
ncbi:outer membrane protein assembly factor BamE [Pseudooceanicola sp. 200-1SW]|uniref:outer membrane protein assembly factor BamE n=1 Tax=Pseudooceanicola sp. 200-1SW TaxID=3425949 RepID=UPI003D7FFF7B